MYYFVEVYKPAYPDDETRFRVHKCLLPEWDSWKDYLSPTMVSLHRVTGAKTRREAVAFMLMGLPANIKNSKVERIL